MTVTAPARRPSVASRRTGYVIGMAVNFVLIYLVDVRPGWSALPFLTADFARVVGLFTASLALGVAVNALYMVNDAPPVKTAGDVLTTAVGLAVLVRLLRVFPFDFAGSTVDWALVARVALWFAVVGTAIGLLVQVVRLVQVLGGLSRGSRGT